MERTRPVSSRLALGAAPRIRSSKMEEISPAEALAALAEHDVDSFWANTPIAADCLATYRKII